MTSSRGNGSGGWGIPQLVLAAALALAAVPGSVHSQAAPTAETTSTTVASLPEGSFLLPPGHWAVAVARRLEGSGLAPGFLPAQRTTPLNAVARALAEAAERAPTIRPDLVEPIAGWRRRLNDEFPGLLATRVEEADQRDEALLLGAAAELGAAGSWGAGAPGLGEFHPTRTGTIALDDRAGPVVGVEAGGVAGPFGAAVRGGWQMDRAVVEALDLSLTWLKATFSVGREAIGYGEGHGGGTIFSGAVPIDRVQFETAAPVRFPRQLGVLGRFSFNTFLAQLREERHSGDPLLWGAQLTVQPIPWLTLAIQRGAMFSGGEDDQAITIRNLFNMAIGRVANVGFEDQIVSGAARLRLPTERVIPVVAYLEWGAEDAAGAWWDVPGRVYGVVVPAVPGLPQAAVGVERAAFTTSCCGNPSWFRHWAFPGSWAHRDRTLAHPLGGDGVEERVHLTLDPLPAGSRLAGAVFRRDRREENLFSPGRTGNSQGFTLEISTRPRASGELVLRGAVERGDGWSEREAGLFLRYFFDF